MSTKEQRAHHMLLGYVWISDLSQRNEVGRYLALTDQVHDGKKQERACAERGVWYLQGNGSGLHPSSDSKTFQAFAFACLQLGPDTNDNVVIQPPAL